VNGKKALFLDRDGVICRAFIRDGKPYPPRTLQELEILPGVKEALRLAGELGFVRIITTNQPDVARGTLDKKIVDDMHALLCAQLEIDDVLVCWHDDADNCACRKPKPGLLFDGAARHGVDLARSYMVGDRWRDTESGVRAGCRTVWIDCHYNEKQPPTPPDHRCHSLAEAVAWIREQR